MKINPFNTIVFLSYLILLFLAIWKIYVYRKNQKTYRYFYGFLITSSLVVIQVLLMDFGIHKFHSWILVLFLPFQYLAPVYFTAFICYYLKKEDVYLKNRIYLLLPFIGFFILYTVLKINLGLDYIWISKEVFTIIHTEVDENSALTFSLILSIWNFFIILRYENTLGKYSFIHVKKKTQWIKTIVGIFIGFNIVWLLTILLFFIREDISGHFPYYPYWMIYIVFYFILLFLGSKHIKKVSRDNRNEHPEIEKTIDDFQLSSLNHILSEEELQLIQQESTEVTGVLSYFATSLFDKNNLEDVLWDITENCISHLQLEDCVIYYLDDENMLVQKAAFGNKNHGERKILSPIRIALGEGIVGQVVVSGTYECIGDLSRDKRYIIDDKNRSSELAVPIIQDNKVIGVLDSEHSKKSFFNDKHILLFQLIAKLTAKKLTQINSRSATNITDDNIYFKELHFLMKEAKIYRDSGLSLENMSRRLKISSNYLSQLVNKISGGNFSEYVNGYRVEDAKIKLKDPKFINYTILSIALESGFNSKSTFYSAFKKNTGVSPKEYRKAP